MNYVLSTMTLEDKIKMQLIFKENGKRIPKQERVTFWLDRLLYADDIALLATSKEELRKKMNIVNSTFAKYGLIISAEKTEWMAFNENKFVNDTITLDDGKTLKKVEEFTYLGSIFTPDCSSQADIENRIKLAHLAIKPLNGLLWSKKVPRNRKKRLFMAFVFPVLTYACETWTLTGGEKTEKTGLRKMLNVVWMKWMRRIYGCTILDKIENEEILETVGEEKLTKKILDRQNKYAGHCYRFPPDRISKLIITASLPSQTKKFMHGRNSWRKQVFTHVQGKSDSDVKIAFERKEKER